MTNFERIIRSKEDLAKQLVWETCCSCIQISKCKIDKRKKCLDEVIEWLDKESELE